MSAKIPTRSRLLADTMVRFDALFRVNRPCAPVMGHDIRVRRLPSVALGDCRRCRRSR